MSYHIWVFKFKVGSVTLRTLRLWHSWWLDVGFIMVFWWMEIIQVHLFFNPTSELAQLLWPVFLLIARFWSFIIYLGLNWLCFTNLFFEHLCLSMGNLIPLLFEMHFKLYHSLFLHLFFIFLFSLLLEFLLLPLQLLLSQDGFSVNHRLCNFINIIFMTLPSFLSAGKCKVWIGKVKQILIQLFII